MGSTTQTLLPDLISFVQESLDDLFEKINNEFNLSLKSALREFTEYHTYKCNYTGFIADPKDLTIYYQFLYDSKENLATLDKCFFVSPEVRHILTNNYLLELESYTKSNLKKYVNKVKSANLSRELFGYEDKFKGLTFFSDFNKLDKYQARKILLDYSYLREKNKQLLILKNLNKNYDFLKEVIIKFDLSFLNKSSFFDNERYVSFKKILPPNLIIELPVTLDYELQQVPEKLKKEQLIDLSSLKMDIS
ncbi:hypothetical protein OVS_00515 [Mycoplasma ovis str. Michigan]|uniref:Uncharacterized protein n=1 Tax=Mycoplasma ovis str. Michigan TaxID=1415773 RepID=A0ABN4BKM9_9MOLU|nr:hypothetical protein [Mycoplasma ovis]AHC39823.1 hypothetical protein OVS_00515 [Mycoplasma ovis str. Michigan]